MLKVIFVLFAFMSLVSAFRSSINRIKNVDFSMQSATPGSYQEMLEQARLRKLGLGQPIDRPQQTSAPPRTVQATEPLQAAQESRRSGLPFNDEVYEHLKYTIGKLTERIKTHKPLTEEELDRFEVAVNAIIADLRGSRTDNNSDSKPAMVSTDTNADISKLPASDLSDPYSLFRGSTSTWQVKGMENMSQSEYYNALNRRNSEFQRLRGSTRSENKGSPSRSYFESLSKKEDK
jgi:hypothetical protein